MQTINRTINRTKKLSNYLISLLDVRYGDMPSPTDMNKLIVQNVIRLCCEEGNFGALKLALERILGKPERPVIVKHNKIVVRYLNATSVNSVEQKNCSDIEQKNCSSNVMENTCNLLEVDFANTPSNKLEQTINQMLTWSPTAISDLLDNKDDYTVAEVIVANFLTIGSYSNNIDAIRLVFDYLDGVVADVVRLDDVDTIILNNYAKIAPKTAIKGDDGVYYVEQTV